jgi:basic amino acid/polyamine antiporter, APA family
MTSHNSELKRTLNLFDVTSIIVGIIIGSAIFKTPSDVAGLLGNGNWILGIWLLGGLFSFIGALCYAELASAYPKEGGDYFFLHHTYGSWAGFLYAWGRLLVIHSGNIAMMAFIAGTYSDKLLPIAHGEKIYALLAVLILTALNCIGLRPGKFTQNILASMQIIGLSLVIFVGFFVSPSTPSVISDVQASQSVPFSAFFLAFIFVQLSFGGWSDCAFVAAEVKNPGKNIFRSLMLGLSIVTIVYFLINASLLYALKADGMAKSDAIMADIMQNRVGDLGSRFISVVAIVCALGSVNGMIIVGGRIYHAWGRDHSLFEFFSQWNKQSSVPLVAFLTQCAISCVLLLWLNFEKLAIFTAAAHWLFMGMVGISLLVLRWREPDVERPFRVPLYPLIPLIYIATCGMLLYSSFNYANFVSPRGALIGFCLVFAGLPVYFVSTYFRKK